jgi:transcriptional regulator
MYVPKHFDVSDPEAIADFIAANSFGTLVTMEAGRPFATHIPFLHDRERGLLLAHVARANPAWQHVGATPDVLVMFLGPHGYVSPTWYAEAGGVPTWNYTAVHVYGHATAIDDAAATARHVERLAAHNERGNAQPWVPSYDARMLGGIVGLEIRIAEIQGKFKMSQNRTARDRERVAARFAAAGTDNGRALARLVAGVR